MVILELRFSSQLALNIPKSAILNYMNRKINLRNTVTILATLFIFWITFESLKTYINPASVASNYIGGPCELAINLNDCYLFVKNEVIITYAKWIISFLILLLFIWKFIPLLKKSK